MAAEPRPPFAWDIVDDLFNGPPLFSPTDIPELFLTVGPPSGARDKCETTAHRLSELGKAFAFDLWHERQPNQTEQDRGLRKLDTALGLALEAAGFGADEPTSEGLYPFLGAGGLFGAAAMRDVPGEASVIGAFRAIYVLQHDARRLAETHAKRRAMKPPTEGNNPQLALKRLVAGLARVYFDVWETPPGFSRGAGRAPSGPFIRLMLEETDALRRRMGNVFPVTAESLAKHWRSLPSDMRLRFAETQPRPA